MDQLRAVEGNLAVYRKQAANFRETLRTLGDAEDAFLRARHTWHELLAERAALIDEQCLKLTQGSGGAIRAQVRRHADATQFFDRLRDAASGSGLRREKIEQLGRSIVESEKPGEHWEAILNELEVLAQHDSEGDASEQLLLVNLIAAGLNWR